MLPATLIDTTASYPQNYRQRKVRRWRHLVQERQSWDTHWRELSDFIQPRRSRFLDSEEQNDGKKKHSNIINGSATWAHRTLAAGMMSGVTSPARPWFRLTTPDPELAELGRVKEWLHDVEELLRDAFAGSNLYKCLPLVYEDLGLYGTGAMLLESDAEDRLRGYVFPVGSYCLAQSARHSVNAIFRQTAFTVGQLREPEAGFDWEQAGDRVKQLHQQGHLDEWVKVLHVIEPNADYRQGGMGYAGKRWSSCWLELEADLNREDKGELRRAGYDEFPLMAPRWKTTGEDVYGASPGMDALGDVKGLQQLEKNKGRMADKIVDPPLAGPGKLRGQNVSLVPGAITYLDDMNGAKLEPVVVVPPAAIQVAGLEISHHEERINRAFYADLWVSLMQVERGAMTAREVAERHEEKLLQLGSVTENLQDELLEPIIDRAFGIGMRSGWFPPPPEELAGVDLKVEFIGLLAQAQKRVRTTDVERFTGYALTLAQAKPEVLDKVDFDQVVDEYANATGVPPSIIRTDEQVAEIRAQRAEQQAQMQAQAEAQAAAESVSKLASANLEGENALTRAVSGLGPIAEVAASQR
ncbi:MAG: portal protein [Candidatus Acidiferrales bacterium]